MIPRTLFMIDGENITNRFKDHIAAKKEKLSNGIVRFDEYFLWHDGLSRIFPMVPLRISYYTTYTGTEEVIEGIRKKISEVEYIYLGNSNNHSFYSPKGNIVPHIFKKENRSSKTKSVDINISIDALKHTYNNSIDRIVLFSGDGDYIPLIQEIMRQGKQVFVGAFSNGLNKHMKTVSDKFIDLDSFFFRRDI